MIRLEKITKVFHEGTVNENIAIKNINLTLKEGSFVTIIGSNGAGKSTLFNFIAGSLFPSEGKIFMKDQEMTRLPEYQRAKKIGRIFQSPLLGTAGNMTIEENMILSLNKGFKGLKIGLNRKRREFFRQALRKLDMNLENRLKDRVDLLSGGQRQALTLLMMVISRPSLILLDEHTAALDPKNAQKVQEVSQYFIREYNLTTMMITHNMSHAIEYGDRLLMMGQGEIIYDVSGEEKKQLTVEKLVQKFHEISKHELESDRMMLAD